MLIRFITYEAIFNLTCYFIIHTKRTGQLKIDVKKLELIFMHRPVKACLPSCSPSQWKAGNPRASERISIANSI